MYQSKQQPRRPSRPKPTSTHFLNPRIREEGGWKFQSTPARTPSSIRPGGGERDSIPPISRPNPKKIAMAVAPVLRGTCPERIRALDEIARLSGERPVGWSKPRYGEFEYWLAHNCGWISNDELADDANAFEIKRRRALDSSHRFSRERYSWIEKPRFEEPVQSGEYVPEISMKLVKDRNLTDSARRTALFVLQKAYQDNREGRLIPMTVSYIMKGLALSRRTVQRSLTLLETRGYFWCEVAKGDATRMCVGLIIHLKQSLFPGHHKESWHKKRRNPGAPSLPQKQIQFYKTIDRAKKRTSRLNWALRCMNGVARRGEKAQLGAPSGRFKTLGLEIDSPYLRNMTCRLGIPRP